MRAGAQKQLITFNTQVQASDGHGGTIATPQIYWSTWAMIEPLKASRTLEAANMELQAVWNFRVRFRPDKTPSKKMWIVHKGKKLEIHSIVQEMINRRDWIITAYERS